MGLVSAFSAGFHKIAVITYYACCTENATNIAQGTCYMELTSVFKFVSFDVWEYGRAMASDTFLQSGMSPVLFPMRPFDI